MGFADATPRQIMESPCDSHNPMLAQLDTSYQVGSSDTALALLKFVL